MGNSKLKKLKAIIESLTADLRYPERWPTEGYRTKGRKTLSELILKVSALEEKQAKIDNELQKIIEWIESI